MDAKGSGNNSSANLVGDKEDSIANYIAIKGSLHAYECAIFGLKYEEVRALESKFPRTIIVNGDAFKTNVMIVLNALVQLGYRIISSTAFNGDLDKIQSLIDKAKNTKEVVTAPDNAGYTALHYAARNGFVNICKLLLQHGADIDARTKSAATPLHKAAASGKLATVNFLIKNGAHIDAQDIDGETVLHKAIQNKHSELIEVFLQASPSLRDIADYKDRLPNI